MSEYFKEVQDMLEQAKELVKTLENKCNELKDKPENIRWKAKFDGDEYFIIPTDEIIMKKRFDWNNDCDILNYQTGNYFKTLEEAEKYKNNLIITQKLKDIALRLNNTSAYPYFIYLNSYGELATSYQSIKVMGGIYCANPDFLETAIKEIGEKELIEYMKGC